MSALNRLNKIASQLSPSKDPTRVDGQVALITGAAQGIGRAAALLLAKQGAIVALNDLDAVKAEATVNELRALGAEASSFPGDALVADFPEKLVAAVLEKYGRINILINNAGTSILPFECHSSLYTNIVYNASLSFLVNRILPRQRRPQDVRREIRHHHEDTQLHAVSDDTRAVHIVDGSREPGHAQVHHQRILDVRFARRHGPDKLFDRQSRRRWHDEVGRCGMGTVCTLLSSFSRSPALLCHFLVLISWKQA